MCEGDIECKDVNIADWSVFLRILYAFSNMRRDRLEGHAGQSQTTDMKGGDDVEI